ncbi:MAG: hypothetical protein JWM07_133 [Candidatus Saccharibacteria bacterium]|jgi:hypothetical protein|nr:hypothetical protein [Candidatus Saccharibacteria bacterium]
MPDMRGMVKAFLLLIIPCVVLMYFTLETNSSYDTPLGFATALICTFAFVPTFVVIGMLFCIVVDYIVLVVRILMEFMGFTGQQRS